MKPQIGKRKLKSSGIDWIGDVPEGWGVQRVGLCFRRHGSGTTPASTNSAYYEGENNWVQSGDLHGDAIYKTEKQLSDSALQEYSLTVYKAPFIAVAMYGASIANTSKVMIDACTNQACCVLCEPEEDFDLDYCFYAIRAARRVLIEAGRGGGQPNINRDVVRKLKIPIPSFDEQKRIAAKLDRLCGRIDELSANLTKEIAALQDYRKSLITECVTKGLNPKVKMKPSGVEWIGKIPAGWTVMRTKYVSRVQTGPFGTQLSADSYTEDGSGVPCVNVKNIGDGVFRVDDLDWVQEDVAERLVNYEIKRGDVIFARKGSVDKRTVAEEEQDGWILGSDSIGVRFDEDVLPRYACYYYGNGVMGQHLHKMAKGSTMPSMNAEIIGNLEIIIPPFDEQCRIAALLDEKCAVIDAKIEERKGQLEKLGEYRSSAIYEYVTGKREVMVDGSSDGG